MRGVAVDGLDKVEGTRSSSAGGGAVGKSSACRCGGMNNRQSRGHKYQAKIVPPRWDHYIYINALEMRPLCRRPQDVRPKFISTQRSQIERREVFSIESKALPVRSNKS